MSKCLTFEFGGNGLLLQEEEGVKGFVPILVRILLVGRGQCLHIQTKERKAKEKERKEKERKGKERKGKEGKERKGKERKEKKRLRALLTQHEHLRLRANQIRSCLQR